MSSLPNCAFSSPEFPPAADGDLSAPFPPADPALPVLCRSGFARAFSARHFHCQADPFPLREPVEKFIEDHANGVNLFFSDAVDSLQGIVRCTVEIQEIMKSSLLKCRGPDPGAGVFQFPDGDRRQRIDCLCPGYLSADSLQGFALSRLLLKDPGKIRLQSLKPPDQFFYLVKIRSVCRHPPSASCCLSTVSCDLQVVPCLRVSCLWLWSRDHRRV